MKEKMHLAILSLGICTLVGMTFAISSRDYKDKAPKLDSATETSVRSQKFVCTASAISDSSQATQEYEKNRDKRDKILVKIDDLGGNSTTLKDPCTDLKGKANTECHINNAELIGVIRQVKKLQENMIPYEECVEEFGRTTKGDKEEKTSVKTNKTENIKATDKKMKDCGTMKENIGETVSPESQKKLTCISNAITSCTPAKIAFKNSEMGDVTYMIYKKNTTSCAIGFSTNEGRSQCDIPLSTIKDLKKYGEEEDMSDFIITPIAMLIMFREGTNTVTGEKFTLTCRDYDSDNKKDTTHWSEGEWSACTIGSQTRKVECLSDGKKVDEKKCARVIQPSTYQKCTNESNLGDIGLSKNNLYGPWVASTQSEIVMIGDLVQFTSDRGGEYVYSCGKDGIRSTNPLHPDSEKLGTFYCTYSSVGKKMVTISYQGKVVASKTFIVKEKVEQSTIKIDQKKYKCVDTDGGLDYSKKGSVTGIWDTYVGDVSDPMYTDTHTDMCLNNYGTINGLPIGLLEHSCNSQGRKTSIDYTCPKGCKDGACIK